MIYFNKQVQRNRNLRMQIYCLNIFIFFFTFIFKNLFSDQVRPHSRMLKVLNREKLALALRGHYISENVQAAVRQDLPVAGDEVFSLRVKGLDPFPIPIPKEVYITC